MTPEQLEQELSKTQQWNRRATDWVDPRAPSPYDLDKRLSLVEASQKDIKEELQQINSNISKLVWIVITAVIVGVLNLVFKVGI